EATAVSASDEGPNRTGCGHASRLAWVKSVKPTIPPLTMFDDQFQVLAITTTAEARDHVVPARVGTRACADHRARRRRSIHARPRRRARGLASPPRNSSRNRDHNLARRVVRCEHGLVTAGPATLGSDCPQPALQLTSPERLVQPGDAAAGLRVRKPSRRAD